MSMNLIAGDNGKAWFCLGWAMMLWK